MILKKRERCPLHNSFFCCGREQNRSLERKPWTKTRKPKPAKAKWTLVAPGVWRVPDEHHPRGYRERRNKAAMTELLKKKCVEQHGLCGICHLAMSDFRDVDPDHIEPRGLGGAWRDDHPDNIQAAHRKCNLEKGSRRLGPVAETPKAAAGRKAEGICTFPAHNRVVGEEGL